MSAMNDATVSNVAASERGVLLVGNLPPGPLVGGVEVGVDMIMRSPLPSRHGMRLFNTARRRDPGRPLWEKLAYQIGRFATFAATVLRMRPRLVHVKAAVGVNYWQAVGYTLIARLLGRRVVLQMHGGGFDTWYDAIGPLKRWAIHAGLRLPHEVIVLSQWWRDYLGAMAPRQRFRIIPNGVEMTNARPYEGSGGPELRVTCIGALGERKGHFDIVAAAAALRDLPVRFVFAGTDEFGGETDRLRERAAAAGVAERIEFAGAVTGADKWALLARSDVFLLPSHAENMPNAVLEAMAAGVAVVTTPVGAVPEMVGDDAILVPAGDPAAIATALRRLHGDPALRARLGHAGRARCVARYSFEAVARALDAVYAGAA